MRAVLHKEFVGPKSDKLLGAAAAYLNSREQQQARHDAQRRRKQRQRDAPQQVDTTDDQNDRQLERDGRQVRDSDCGDRDRGGDPAARES